MIDIARSAPRSLPRSARFPAVAGVLAAVALQVGCASGPKYPVLGSIDRRDPRLDTLIAPGTRIEQIAGGFKWTEGAVWCGKEKAVLFSDIPNNRICVWREGDTAAADFLKPAGYTGPAPGPQNEPGSNGLAFDSEHRLVLCQHGDRRIARWEGGKFVTLADKYEGKRLNSPNDLVFAANGDLYFTDPPYGLDKRTEDPAKELDFQGVYRLSKDGKLTLLTKELSRPNGIGLSPDGKTLYVANSDPAKAVWVAFPIQADGSLGPSKLIHDATAAVPTKPGLPDGLKVDKAGNIFATGPGGVYVFAPDLTLLGILETNDKTANVGFGDDGKTLYICKNHEMARIRTLTVGLGF